MYNFFAENTGFGYIFMKSVNQALKKGKRYNIFEVKP